MLTIGKFTDIKYAYPYCLDGNQLEHVFEEKDLGILIDSELTSEEHIAKQVKKANSILGMINRSFERLNPTIIPPIYDFRLLIVYAIEL